MTDLFNFVFSSDGQLMIFVIDLVLIYYYAQYEFSEKLRELKRKRRKVPIIEVMPNPIVLLIIAGLSFIPVIQLIIFFLLIFFLLATWKI